MLKVALTKQKTTKLKKEFDSFDPDGNFIRCHKTLVI